MDEQLTDRKKRILKAIIRTYMEDDFQGQGSECQLSNNPERDV